MKAKIVALCLILSLTAAYASTGSAGESKAFCPVSIFYGLELANPTGETWETTNGNQEVFLFNYAESEKDIGKLRSYLDGKIAHSSSELNDWFISKNFPNMNVDIPNGGAGIGTIFDLLVDWETPGQKTPLYVYGDQNKTHEYAGVQMTSNQFKSWDLEKYDFPLFELETKQGWKVLLLETKDNIEEARLPREASLLMKLKRTPRDVPKLLFPAVEMEKDVDISWLKGMSVTGFQVDEARGQIRFHLDDKGARAQSAVALTMRGLENKYTIKNPFLVIFWKEGLALPAFVAIATPDSWIRKE